MKTNEILKSNDRRYIFIWIPHVENLKISSDELYRKLESLSTSRSGIN